MMLVITVHVNAPAGQAIGIKEQIAQDLERYGDTRVVSVEVVQTNIPANADWRDCQPTGWQEEVRTDWGELLRRFSELNQHFELIEKLARAREMLQSLRDAACPGAAAPHRYAAYSRHKG